MKNQNLKNQNQKIKNPRLESSEQIIGVYDNKNYNFDRYNFEKRTPLSTQEITVVIDFENRKINGDKIAYGEWYDIELEECIELLKTLDEEEILRDFNNLIETFVVFDNQYLTLKDAEYVKENHGNAFTKIEVKTLNFASPVFKIVTGEQVEINE